MSRTGRASRDLRHPITCSPQRQPTVCPDADTTPTPISMHMHMHYRYAPWTTCLCNHPSPPYIKPRPYSAHLCPPQAIIATPVAAVPLCEIKFDLCCKDSTFHLGTLFRPIACIAPNRLARRATLDTHFDHHTACNAFSRLVRLQTAVAHPPSVPCSFLAAHGKNRFICSGAYM